MHSHTHSQTLRYWSLVGFDSSSHSSRALSQRTRQAGTTAVGSTTDQLGNRGASELSASPSFTQANRRCMVGSHEYCSIFLRRRSSSAASSLAPAPGRCSAVDMVIPVLVRTRRPECRWRGKGLLESKGMQAHPRIVATDCDSLVQSLLNHALSLGVAASSVARRPSRCAGLRTCPQVSRVTRRSGGSARTLNGWVLGELELVTGAEEGAARAQGGSSR